MLISELHQFRDQVAQPVMRQLLEKTQIPDGYCCINNLSISMLDGRSCGTENVWKASGLKFCAGRVEEYIFEREDLSAEEFVQAHQNCVFLFEGKLHIYEELFPMEINTEIGLIGQCAKIFPELPDTKTLNIIIDTVPLLKMVHILDAQNASLLRKSPDDSPEMQVNRVVLLRERAWENAFWTDDFWVDANKTPTIDLFKAAVQEYLNTPDGMQEIKNTCEDFNWGDAVMYVPSDIWNKHGIYENIEDMPNLTPARRDSIILKVNQDEVLIPDSYYDMKTELISLDDALSSARQNKSNSSGTVSRDNHDLDVF